MDCFNLRCGCKFEVGIGPTNPPPEGKIPGNSDEEISDPESLKTL